jgi:glycosyltransferase involved in cell wall biosynthesis
MTAATPSTLPPPRIAIVADWLSTYAGAERVLEQMLLTFPEAEVFAVVDAVPLEERAFLQGKTVHTTFIQRLPWGQKRFRAYLPLMPLAIEQLDLSGFDVVLSSSHAVAKGVLVGPDQLHISYVHSPLRYAWDMQAQYLREAQLTRGPKSWLVRWLLHRLRLWDARSAAGVDHFLANSRFIARRIAKCYRREAEVLYPPVALDDFSCRSDKEDFYLTVSRLVPYKRVDLIVEAFTAMPQHKLVVIGDGPEMERIRKLAGPNVTLMGYQSFSVVREQMQKARAFLFAAQEDFGIAPVEAQACGTPVIAYGRGGATESIRGPETEQPTGLFFPEQNAASLVAAVERFESLPTPIRAEDCRANAERFSAVAFRSALKQTVLSHWASFADRAGLPVTSHY